MMLAAPLLICINVGTFLRSDFEFNALTKVKVIAVKQLLTGRFLYC